MRLLRLLLLATVQSAYAGSPRWREALLQEARERILQWYVDPNLLEAPSTKDGITINMLKKDLACGGDDVPVTFVDFIVEGARPIDIFNTMLDAPKQKSWDPEAASVEFLGDWKSEGARAWSSVFDVPVISDRQFLQWQVADANFTSQEFWVVFTTQNNSALKEKTTIKAGATEAHNCLGGYHITKHPGGAHVIITQQLNAHAFLLFPMHQVLKFVPMAWTATLDFVHHMSDNSRKLAATGSALDSTDAPRYMLQRVETSPLIGRSEYFPALQSASAVQDRSPFLGSSIFWVTIASFVCVFTVVGRSIAAVFPTRNCRCLEVTDASSDNFRFTPDRLEQEALL